MDKKPNDFMKGLNTSHRVTSMENPYAIWQAEAVNKVILMELKKKLELAKGKWTEELLEVLWGIQCTL